MRILPKSKFEEKVRVVYIKSTFFESLMEKALKRYGFRMTLAKALGYSSPGALSRNTERNGLLVKRFLKLCDLAGVKFEEAQPHIIAIALYGNRKKLSISKALTDASVELKSLNSLFS